MQQDGDQGAQQSQSLEEVRRRLNEIFQLKDFIAVLARCVCGPCGWMPSACPLRCNCWVLQGVLPLGTESVSPRFS